MDYLCLEITPTLASCVSRQCLPNEFLTKAQDTFFWSFSIAFEFASLQVSKFCLDAFATVSTNSLVCAEIAAVCRWTNSA